MPSVGLARRPTPRGMCAAAKPASTPPVAAPPIPSVPPPTGGAHASGASADVGGAHFPLMAGAIGLFAGCFGSLLGVGGGVVMVPLFTSLGGLSQHMAHGTSLVAVVSTGLAGCLSFGSQGQVDWATAAAVASTASVSAILGARATSSLSGASLKRLTGVFMMVVAPLVPLKEPLARWARDAHGQGAEDAAGAASVGAPSLVTLAQCAALGVVSGALTGLFGVGGGSIVTPALALITDLPHQAVLGTTLASMVIPSLLGAHTHWRLGNVLTRALPGLLLGSALGAAGGAQLAMELPQEGLKWFFCVAFLVLGAKGAFKL